MVACLGNTNKPHKITPNTDLSTSKNTQTPQIEVVLTEEKPKRFGEKILIHSFLMCSSGTVHPQNCPEAAFLLGTTPLILFRSLSVLGRFPNICATCPRCWGLRIARTIFFNISHDVFRFVSDATQRHRKTSNSGENIKPESETLILLEK